MVRVTLVMRFGFRPKMMAVYACDDYHALQTAILMHDPFQQK